MLPGPPAAPGHPGSERLRQLAARRPADRSRARRRADRSATVRSADRPGTPRPADPYRARRPEVRRGCPRPRSHSRTWRFAARPGTRRPGDTSRLRRPGRASAIRRPAAPRSGNRSSDGRPVARLRTRLGARLASGSFSGGRPPGSRTRCRTGVEARDRDLARQSLDGRRKGAHRPLLATEPGVDRARRAPRDRQASPHPCGPSLPTRGLRPDGPLSLGIETPAVDRHVASSRRLLRDLPRPDRRGARGRSPALRAFGRRRTGRGSKELHLRASSATVASDHGRPPTARSGGPPAARCVRRHPMEPRPAIPCPLGAARSARPPTPARFATIGHVEVGDPPVDTVVNRARDRRSLPSRPQRLLPLRPVAPIEPDERVSRHERHGRVGHVAGAHGEQPLPPFDRAPLVSRLEIARDRRFGIGHLPRPSRVAPGAAQPAKAPAGLPARPSGAAAEPRRPELRPALVPRCSAHRARRSPFVRRLAPFSPPRRQRWPRPPRSAPRDGMRRRSRARPSAPPGRAARASPTPRPRSVSGDRLLADRRRSARPREAPAQAMARVSPSSAFDRETGAGRPRLPAAGAVSPEVLVREADAPAGATPPPLPRSRRRAALGGPARRSARGARRRHPRSEARARPARSDPIFEPPTAPPPAADLDRPAGRSPGCRRPARSPGRREPKDKGAAHATERPDSRRRTSVAPRGPADSRRPTGPRPNCSIPLATPAPGSREEPRHLGPGAPWGAAPAVGTGPHAAAKPGSLEIFARAKPPAAAPTAGEEGGADGAGRRVGRADGSREIAPSARGTPGRPFRIGRAVTAALVPMRLPELHGFEPACPVRLPSPKPGGGTGESPSRDGFRAGPGPAGRRFLDRAAGGPVR